MPVIAIFSKHCGLLDQFKMAVPVPVCRRLILVHRTALEGDLGIVQVIDPLLSDRNIAEHFPCEHRARIASKTEIERADREIERQADVIVIFRNDEAIIR
jgi:hypothetical protein